MKKITYILEMGNNNEGSTMWNVLNSTELNTYKWFKWQILSYIYFTTIKKMTYDTTT